MRAVITGATSGIGEAIARRLAAGGAAVTLVGRSDQRLRAARDRIAAAAPSAELRLERADFAELDEIRDLAERLLAGPRPDVVVSNAALVTSLDRRNSAGLPRLLAVNHLAPYLLLRTLAATLQRARFVLVGADPVALSQAPVDLDDLCFTRPERLGEPVELRPFRAYGETKNMTAMFAFELASRLAGTGLTVNAAHPGIIAGSRLSTELPGLSELVARTYDFDPADLPGPDVGADTPTWLATAPELDGVTGRFFVDRHPVDTATHTTDPTRRARLWTETAHLVDLPA